ncbi:hypothetical protein NPIL_316601 [Nephila pilipes]|uniref:Uncharacterized protein n=1 Tax=Nephila pilipes TaxID=299642 RepID=A0A8X6UN90_NEPPI|nr:hypothetical protein NPIL_316601 [Nephila pilipes]
MLSFCSEWFYLVHLGSDSFVRKGHRKGGGKKVFSRVLGILLLLLIAMANELNLRCIRKPQSKPISPLPNKTETRIPHGNNHRHHHPHLCHHRNYDFLRPFPLRPRLEKDQERSPRISRKQEQCAFGGASVPVGRGADRPRGCWVTQEVCRVDPVMVRLKYWKRQPSRDEQRFVGHG